MNVGQNVMVGAGAVVVKDVPPDSVTVGRILPGPKQGGYWVIPS